MSSWKVVKVPALGFDQWKLLSYKVDLLDLLWHHRGKHWFWV